MAAGAVGHPDFAESGCGPVEGIGVSFEPRGQETVLAGKRFVVVAPAANGGDLRCIDARAQVLVGKDLVFVVAIGADGDVLDALDIILAVHTFEIISFHTHVAAPASPG